MFRSNSAIGLFASQVLMARAHVLGVWSNGRPWFENLWDDQCYTTIMMRMRCVCSE